MKDLLLSDTQGGRNIFSLTRLGDRMEGKGQGRLVSSPSSTSSSHPHKNVVIPVCSEKTIFWRLAYSFTETKLLKI